jgi:hypothetical protein
VAGLDDVWPVSLARKSEIHRNNFSKFSSAQYQKYNDSSIYAA